MERKVIFVVEDDAALRNLLKETLLAEFEVLESSNYSEAVNQSENNIDLALIDYALPGRDGFEVLKMLREKRPSLPAIIMTAYSSEELAIKAVRTGATDYVKKPFYFEHLKIMISGILTGNKSEEYHENILTRDEFIIEGIKTYIKNNYMAALTREDLAEMASMDKYKFSKTFKRYAGQSLPSFINRVRIDKAVELLKSSFMGIKEASHFAGYRNVEHFNRLFNALYGISPLEFRKKLNK